MKIFAVFLTAILIAGIGSCNRAQAQATITAPNGVRYTTTTTTVPNIVSNGTVVDPKTITTTDNLLKQGVGSWSNTVQGQAGGLSGGPTPAYNPGTDTIIFSYTKQQVAQQIAINQALQNSGLALIGYGYSWQIGNYGQNSGTLTGVVDLKKGNNVLESYTHSYGPQQSDFITYSGLQPFSKSYPLSAVDTLSLTWTGQDATFWAGYWGPRVRNPSLSLVYGTDLCYSNPLTDSSCPGYQAAYTTQQCNANPLYSPSCPGYQAAYTTQQCSANPLYSTACPGYQAAYLTAQCTNNPLYSSACPGYQQAYHDQQCSINPLYATDCPGYQQAYLNAQCIKDSLYSPLCSGYKTAYAIKYLTPNIDSAAVNQSLSGTAAVAASNPTSVNTNGSVSTTPSSTGNTTADSVIATPSTTSTTSATSVSPAATNSVVTPQAPAGSPMSSAMSGPQQGGGNQGGGQPQQNQPQQANNQAPARKEQPQSKENQQEKQKEAMAANKGAKSMDEQKATQGALIASMGAVPGFDAYASVVIKDSLLYKPYSIYKNQVTVDNRRASRGLFGPSDVKFNEIVDSQYNRGN